MVRVGERMIVQHSRHFFGGLADGMLARILEEMMGHTTVYKEVTVE